jgi:hypothetical protein
MKRTLPSTMMGTAFLLILTAIGLPAIADEEVANRPHVVADPNGGLCYAKSVPNANQGKEGSTAVYKVESSRDELLYTLPWYSQEVHVRCGIGRKWTPAVVQMGPWNTGRSASADHLALAFYYDGKLVKRYSTLEIAGAAGNVRTTKSHYTVIRSVTGFTNDYPDARFVVVTEDGRRLAFDPVTGTLLSTERTDKGHTGSATTSTM